MGYKVWRGGKSVWFSTAKTSAGQPDTHKSKEPTYWNVPQKDGTIRKVRARSASEARAQFPDTADPRKKVTRASIA